MPGLCLREEEREEIRERAAMTPAMNVLQKVLTAYKDQRDPVNDSDLDNEQPISLSVRMTLGDFRKMRSAVIQAGGHPPNFIEKAR